MKVNDLGLDTSALEAVGDSISLRPISVRSIQYFLLITDLVLLFICFNFGYWIRFSEWEPHYLLTYQMIHVMLITVACLYTFDAFDPRAHISGLYSPLRFVIAVMMAGALIALATYAMGGALNMQFGRGVMGLSLGPFAVIGGVLRWSLNHWLERRDSQLNWLVVGSHSFSRQFHADVLKLSKVGTVHFLIPEGEELDSNLPILGRWGDLDRFMRRKWSGIIVCTGDQIPNEIVDRLLSLRLSGVRVLNLSDFYEEVWLKVPVYFVDRSWLLLTQGFSLLHNPIGLRLKRVGDLIGSIVLIPLCLPVILLAAFFIYLEDRHSPIYSQKRIGLDGREFMIYKLRTMIPESGEATWSAENDSRITWVGKYLRKFRFDELPQIWNVLMGDMSFIGPRPELPSYREDLEATLPHYRLRYLVRPGITGWAQVLFKYGSSLEDAREKLQYDLYYIKNYSLILDFAIVFKTFRVLLLGQGR